MRSHAERGNEKNQLPADGNTMAADTDTPAGFETVLDAGTVRGRLARVYAEAVFAAAGEQYEEVGRDLAAVVRDVFAADSSVEAYLSSPAVSRRVKGPVIEQAFAGRVSPVVRNLLAVLNQNNRLDLLRSVQAAYQGLLDKRAGRVRVKVRAATPLADDQRERLTQTLAARLGRQPVLDVRVEPELLGGLVVQVGDRVYDTSVRSRINELRTQLMAQGASYVAKQV